MQFALKDFSKADHKEGDSSKCSSVFLPFSGATSHAFPPFSSSRFGLPRSCFPCALLVAALGTGTEFGLVATRASLLNLFLRTAGKAYNSTRQWRGRSLRNIAATVFLKCTPSRLSCHICLPLCGIFFFKCWRIVQLLWDGLGGGLIGYYWIVGWLLYASSPTFGFWKH